MPPWPLKQLPLQVFKRTALERQTCTRPALGLERRETAREVTISFTMPTVMWSLGQCAFLRADRSC